MNILKDSISLNYVHFKLIRLMNIKIRKAFKYSYLWFHIIIGLYILSNVYVNKQIKNTYVKYLDALLKKEFTTRLANKKDRNSNLDLILQKQFIKKIEFSINNSAQLDNAIQLFLIFNKAILKKSGIFTNNQLDSINTMSHFISQLKNARQIPPSFLSLSKSILDRTMTYTLSDIILNLDTFSNHNYKESDSVLHRLFSANLQTGRRETLYNILLPDKLRALDETQKVLQNKKIDLLFECIKNNLNKWCTENYVAIDEATKQNLSELFLILLFKDLEYSMFELIESKKRQQSSNIVVIQPLKERAIISLKTIEKFKASTNQMFALLDFIINSPYNLSDIISTINYRNFNTLSQSTSVTTLVKSILFYSLEEPEFLKPDVLNNYRLINRLNTNLIKYKEFVNDALGYINIKNNLFKIVLFYILFNCLTFVFNLTTLRNTIIRYIYCIIRYEEWVSCLFISKLINILYFLTLVYIMNILLSYINILDVRFIAPFRSIITVNMISITKYILTLLSLQFIISFWCYYSVSEFNLVTVFNLTGGLVTILNILLVAIFSIILLSRYIRLSFSITELRDILTYIFTPHLSNANIETITEQYFSTGLINTSYLERVNYRFNTPVITVMNILSTSLFILSLISPFIANLKEIPIIGVVEYVVVT